jgi:hypothetical protein
MTNRKSKTIRKIGHATQIAVLPPPASTRTCPPSAENGRPITSEPRTCRVEISSEGGSRMTNHTSRPDPPAIQLPASDSQRPIGDIPNPVPKTIRKLSRNGKIARLAKPLRDMVNLMLQNNIQHSMIAEALEEHDVRVTKRNISNWKTRGGYNEWRLEHERIITKRLRQDNITDYLRATNATHLPEVGLQLAATQLCEFLLNPQTEQQLTSNPEKFARTLSNLCRITRHLHLLQKYRDDSARELGYDHVPERVKREHEKRLETTRDVYSAEKLGETINDRDISHRNFLTKDGYPPAPPEHHEPRDNSNLDFMKQFLDGVIARQANAQKLRQNSPSPDPTTSDDATNKNQFDPETSLSPSDGERDQA